MPGPPPPPPPTAPPPPSFTTSSKGGVDDRSALLKSIRTGAKLKKTVTNDKSAPVIPGKITNNATIGGGGGGGGGSGSSISSTSSVPNGMNLGGLFAGGMPKLRATGKLGASSLSNSTNNINNNNSNNENRKKPDTPVQPVKSFNSVQNELKKQMASDNRNRGPPPPAPVRNISNENGLKSSTPTELQPSSINGYVSNQSALHGNLQINHSTLHRKAISNANLTTLDHTDSVNGFGQSTTITKPVINHGKPNLAPKPPILNGKPLTPPKKLLINGKPVSRAHSMKSPRTPSPSSTASSLSLQQSPDNNAAIKFGTVRNLSSVISQSLGHSTGNLSPRPRPLLNGRPSAPPPSVPNQVPPPPPPHSPSSNMGQQSYKASSINGGNVRPPNHAPPPPPPNIVLPQPPNHAPPLPPHRTQPTRPPPAKENYHPQVPAHLNAAPPPPPRQSSMRDSNNHNNSNNNVRRQAADFDEKFKHMFHQTNMFPKPPPYRHLTKFYSHRQAISKQQAPQPPNLQTNQPHRTWDNASAC